MTRPPAILDLYVLSLLDRGLTSFYDLQKQGGLSLGASTPSMKRLLKAALAKKTEHEKTGKRVRYQFGITRAGKEALRNGLQVWMSGRTLPNDIDAALRLVDMALHYRYPRTQISSLCSQSAQGRKQAATALNAASRSDWKQATSYPALRIACNKEMLSAEARALGALARELGPRAAGTQTTAETTRNPRRRGRSKPL